MVDSVGEEAACAHGHPARGGLARPPSGGEVVTPRRLGRDKPSRHTAACGIFRPAPTPRTTPRKKLAGELTSPAARGKVCRYSPSGYPLTDGRFAWRLSVFTVFSLRADQAKSSDQIISIP